MPRARMLATSSSRSSADMFRGLAGSSRRYKTRSVVREVLGHAAVRGRSMACEAAVASGLLTASRYWIPTHAPAPR
jgi:hypothetical protein